ncbi:response regulator transcription factor [Colwellia sp. Arc7-D]|uniref:response regulator transcription factor n=1 Tax=Colwellia sp. Arc7-D TaxID=2161872 RepID=UPI000D34945F|nr:response regulator transcription factor [Colwellia sp. Arc7-D]AWB56354.1 DNA-binding response regulator [Colwellia sp. Arc7-D]
MPQILCKLLLIEDDLPLASLICQYLRAKKCDVVHISTGAEVSLLVNHHDFDIVICDVMLPDINGFELLKIIQQKMHCPVIFLTALDDDKDQIHGLEIGAADYVVKPIEPAVLLARINVHIREHHKSTSLKKIRFDDFVIDAVAKKISVAGEVLPFTIQEVDVLHLLANHHNDIVAREVLFKHIVGRDYDGLDRAIDLIMSRLRKKLIDLTLPQLTIRSIRGKGYMLNIDTSK